MIGVALSIVASLALIGRFNLGYVSGDPLIYHQRMSEMFQGTMPYIEGEYEHLPLMLLPMAATWLLGGWQGAFTFRAIWVALSTVVMLVITTVLGQIDHQSDEISRRWFILSLPLVPVAVFRTEPWLLLAVSFALQGFVRRNQLRSSLGTIAGVFGKGWPVLLTVWSWRLGWRRSALIVGSVGILGLLTISTFPGFISGRTFAGLHSESLGGSLWALLALLQGENVGLIGVAGAVYVDAPTVMYVPAAMGFVFVVWQMWRSRTQMTDMPLVFGSVLAAALPLLPLQSTQFLLWLSPFVVFSRNRLTQIVYIAIGSAGLIGLIGFEALLSQSAWWFVLAAARNGGLLFLALRLSGEAFRSPMRLEGAGFCAV